jgi:hypothetical protein
VTLSSIWFSCFMPHGAVASSLCRPKAVTCIVLKMSVIGSNLASFLGRIDKISGLRGSSRPLPRNLLYCTGFYTSTEGGKYGKARG